MAKLILTSSEFADIVALILFDKLQKPDKFIPAELNIPFHALSEIMKRRGMRSSLLQYYLRSNPMLRQRYRLIRNVFHPSKTKGAVVSYFEVRSEVLPEPEESKGLITKIINLVKRMIGIGKRK